MEPKTPNKKETNNHNRRDLWQNVFLAVGAIVLIVMITQLDFAQVWSGLRHAGYWFFAVVALWAFLYLFNTAASRESAFLICPTTLFSKKACRAKT